MYAALPLGALVMILWLTAAWMAFTDKEPYDAVKSSLSNDRNAA